MNTVKGGGGVSSFFPVNMGARQGSVLAPSILNTCMDWVLGRVVEQSHCGTSVGNTKITDLDDAVIFAESLEVLAMALEALHEEVKALGHKASWAKTKLQVFGGILDETIQSVHVCGEEIEILKNFTYLDSVVHNESVKPKRHMADWPGPRRYGFAQHEYLAFSIPVQMDKDSDLQIAGDPCLTLWL